MPKKKRLKTTKVPRPRVLVLGMGSRAASVGEAARQSRSGGNLNIVGYLPLKETQCHVEGAHVLAAGDSVMNVVRAHRINEIVIAVSDSRIEGLPVHELLECELRGVKITESAVFFERERCQLHIDSLDANWMMLNGGFRQSFARRTVKRLFDVAASAVLLIAMLPVMLITSLCIAVESGAPVLYFQKRVGQRGRVFTIFKFRSMKTDAEVDGRPRWADVDGARVTRVGRFIRKLRIDELPQIFNVFNGDMSFVGPRPERPFFVEQLTSRIRHYDARHSVKPGITGWAQVSYPYGASHYDAVEKCQYDLYYVKNHTLLLDVMILLDTVRVVVLGRGAR
jgi:sugar transferase (PEP-CTERM system associated)